MIELVRDKRKGRDFIISSSNVTFGVSETSRPEYRQTTSTNWALKFLQKVGETRMTSERQSLQKQPVQLVV